MLLAWELYKNIMFGQIEINTRIILKIFAILNTIFLQEYYSFARKIFADITLSNTFACRLLTFGTTHTIIDTRQICIKYTVDRAYTLNGFSRVFDMLHQHIYFMIHVLPNTFNDEVNFFRIRSALIITALSIVIFIMSQMFVGQDRKDFSTLFVYKNNGGVIILIDAL